MPVEALWEILAILLLILLNGFFSLAEMALVASRKSRLATMARQGKPRAAQALKLLEEPDRLFSTVQIGITLVGVLAGVFGGATLSVHLETWLAAQPLLAAHAPGIALGVVILCITALSLVLGELLPKKAAFSDPERFACLTAPAMLLVRTAARPAVGLLALASRALARLMGLPRRRQDITEEDIKAFINEGVRAGVVPLQERDMLERVFRLDDRCVATLMTHRSRVEWLDAEASDMENLARMAQSTHSRFPVRAGELNDILGVVKAKDYLAAHATGHAVPLSEHLRQPVFIPDTARASALLEAFRSRNEMRFAVVVDEYGDIMGIATLHDLLEAIVGDLPDQHDEGEPQAVAREDGSWLLDGLLPLREACAAVDFCWPQDEPRRIETLAGFLMHQLGRLPKIGDVVRWRGLRFEIVDMDARRIDRVLLSREQTPPEQ